MTNLFEKCTKATVYSDLANILQQEFHLNLVFHHDQLWTAPDPKIQRKVNLE